MWYTITVSQGLGKCTEEVPDPSMMRTIESLRDGQLVI